MIDLLLVLTLAACLNAFQEFAPLPSDAAGIAVFLRILCAKLVYFWYFLGLAFVVKIISRHFMPAPQTAHRWLAIHCAALAASFTVHEALMFGVNRLLFGTHEASPVFIKVFNNPGVWIETFVYALLLLGFSLLEYRRTSMENEMACAALEAQLEETKLHELRMQIQPAFLTSTLGTILGLVRERRNEDANRILSLLSDYLRTTVYGAHEGNARLSARDHESDALRSSQLHDVQTEIERIVREDQNAHH